ncbi:MAG: hypothetical protein IPM02_06560 [Betaproteobacteria bacterium]|nr:hypothetical protein [Betaproteobacteria bacterium]
MTARTRHATRDSDRASATTQPMQRTAGPSALRAAAPRGWVSEAIGFDSRIPAVVVTAGTGAGHFQYEKVAVDDARPERGGKLAVPTPVPRPQANLEPLADSTMRWLAELPAGSRPAELARLFPRVANKVCGLWADPRRCGEYLTNLLMDTRDGSRQGFPMKVAAEIVALHAGAETPAADHPSGQVKIKSEQ